MKTNAEAHAVPTPEGRFAVVQGGLTLGELHCEATALQVAAAINQGPVRCVGVPRFDRVSRDGAKDAKAA